MRATKRYDKHATIKNSRHMLEQYRYYIQFARQLPLPDKILIQQADYQRMNYLARQQFARCYCYSVDDAIKALDDKTSRQLVRAVYIEPVATRDAISKQFNMSKSALNHRLENILFELATKCNGMPVISMDHSIKYQSLLVNKQPAEVNG